MKATPEHTITISDQAVDTLNAQARASRHRERGGILIGYRIGTALHIHDALPVADATAAHTRYLRRNRDGQQALNDWMNATDDPTLGYVGEWHTHPAPAPPSSTDLTSARIMAIKNRRPVALVVAALANNKQDVTLHAVLTRPTTLARRLTGAISTARLETAG